MGGSPEMPELHHHHGLPLVVAPDVDREGHRWGEALVPNWVLRSVARSASLDEVEDMHDERHEESSEKHES